MDRSPHVSSRESQLQRSHCILAWRLVRHQGKYYRVEYKEKKAQAHPKGYRQTNPYHWLFLQTLVSTTGITCILPHYTKAPLTTAPTCILHAIEFLLELSSDPRYSGKEIILVGDSAGGWISSRLLCAMTELALDEPILGGGRMYQRLDKIRSTRAMMKRAILISPALELDMAGTTFQDDSALQKDVSASRSLRAIR